MKKYIIAIIALVLSLSAMASNTNKKSYLYAVKGTDSLYLDHYVSPVSGKRPCMIYVFGGGFVRGTRDNESYAPYFKFLNDKGFDVVSIDYRLGLKVLTTMQHMPSIRETIGLLNDSVNFAVEDLFSATLFILENAEKWQIDTEKIVTSGTSAGAIAVLQAENAICNRTPSAAVLPQGFNYAGVISYAGAIFSVDGKPKWTEKPAPIMFFHGSSDAQVPYNKATMLGIGFYGPKFLTKEFADNGWAHWFYDIEYHTHSVSYLPMFENHNEIATFLNEFVLKKHPLTITTSVRDGDLPKRETKFKVMDYIDANYKK